MTSRSFSLPSFAKINRHLEILGKRPDGYHELRTILQTISLHDDIHFELRDDSAVTLSCDDPDIPTGDRNLIIRAANAVKDRFDVRRGAHLRLRKRIPTQAGLGGGSSNAAVSLLGLTHLWQLENNHEAVVGIARELGADVPFFLIGGTALGEGTGTRLSPLPEVTPEHLLVIKPTAAVSTADAYAAMNSDALTTSVANPILSSSPTRPDFREFEPAVLHNDLRNDFESVIFDIEPEIRRSKEALLHAGARAALLAGSGSSVFGLFADQEARAIAIEKIQLEAGWRVFACDTLSRNEYICAMSVDDVSLIRFFISDSDIGA